MSTHHLVRLYSWGFTLVPVHAPLGDNVFPDPVHYHCMPFPEIWHPMPNPVDASQKSARRSGRSYVPSTYVYPLRGTPGEPPHRTRLDSRRTRLPLLLYQQPVTGIIFSVFPAIPGTKGDGFICSPVNRATAFYPFGYSAGLADLCAAHEPPSISLPLSLLYTCDLPMLSLGASICQNQPAPVVLMNRRRRLRGKRADGWRREGLGNVRSTGALDGNLSLRLPRDTCRKARAHGTEFQPDHPRDHYHR